MSILDILLTSIGLAMDAFAVAICKGLSIKNNLYKKAIIIGLYFGIFQGMMPLVGYILGISFQDIIIKLDHWIAFVLLSIIGLNMVKESITNKQLEVSDNINIKEMFPLALATSIDALTLGITFAFLKVNILYSVILIAIITFILSVFGVIIGNNFGIKLGKKAEFVGGVILIMIGFKILVEHLNII